MNRSIYKGFYKGFYRRRRFFFFKIGGNQWAGGSGGFDTAGLGGVGGPYRYIYFIYSNIFFIYVICVYLFYNLDLTREIKCFKLMIQ